MPTGISSVRVNADVESALFTDGEDKHTVRPLWKLNTHPRLRVAEAFLERTVEVDVWPNRQPSDPENYTVRHGRVLSAAHNPHWSKAGTTILVLEFPVSMTKRDLPIPMSQIAAIRTVAPTPEEGDERSTDQL